MGCPRLTYQEKNERSNFLAVWKKSDESEKRDNYYPFGLSFNQYSRENSVPQNYLYNGKELQKDLALNWEDYGQRMYQPELGRFFTQDRFAEMYYPLHPYQYAANNPVMYVDINGDSLMLFKNGAYVTTVDNGKKEMTGFNQESKTNKDGKEEFTGGQSFDFNDFENDGDVIGDLKSGAVTLNVLSNKDVDNAVSERSGADGENVFSRWGTAWNESPAGGKMDFSISPKIKSGTLNIMNGSAYNEKDAGNYMWGYAMRKMGYTTTMAKLAAHVHAWSSGKQENGQESNSTNPVVRWWENKTWGGDSEADQRAIVKGMNAAGSYWSNKKKSIVNLFK